MAKISDFDMIMNRYLKSVCNFVFRLSGSESDASDITQDVFVKVWKNLDKITHPNLKPWIFTVARNTAFDFLRKRKNISFSELDFSDSEENERDFQENIVDFEPLPDEVFQKKELVKELENALSKIRPDFREIIFLHYTEDLTFAEISEITDKPLNTVKSHHFRALSALRKLLL